MLIVYYCYSIIGSLLLYRYGTLILVNWCLQFYVALVQRLVQLVHALYNYIVNMLGWSLVLPRKVCFIICFKKLFIN